MEEKLSPYIDKEADKEAINTAKLHKPFLHSIEQTHPFSDSQPGAIRAIIQLLFLKLVVSDPILAIYNNKNCENRLFSQKIISLQILLLQDITLQGAMNYIGREVESMHWNS